MLTDAHCHLTSKDFSRDIDKVVERAKNVMIVSSGVNLEDNKRVLELAKRFKNVKAGLGLYPVDALKLDEKGFEENLEFIRKNKDKLVYIGEAGLDYKDKGHQRPPYQPCATTMRTEQEDRERQKGNFLKIIGLAERIKKPLLVHSRTAERECFELVESSDLKRVIFHCFTGKLKLAKKIANKGWSFSIPCSVVRNPGFHRLVKEIYISQLLIQTDAPYMSPFGGRNEPCFVAESVVNIAELKSLEMTEVENILEMNFQKMLLL